MLPILHKIESRLNKEIKAFSGNSHIFRGGEQLFHGGQQGEHYPAGFHLLHNYGCLTHYQICVKDPLGVQRNSLKVDQSAMWGIGLRTPVDPCPPTPPRDLLNGRDIISRQSDGRGRKERDRGTGGASVLQLVEDFFNHSIQLHVG